MRLRESWWPAPGYTRVLEDLVGHQGRGRGQRWTWCRSQRALRSLSSPVGAQRPTAATLGDRLLLPRGPWGLQYAPSRPGFTWLEGRSRETATPVHAWEEQPVSRNLWGAAPG